MSRLTISLPPAQQLVDGKLTGASDGAAYPILDPATGQEIGVAPDSSAARAAALYRRTLLMRSTSKCIGVVRA